MDITDLPTCSFLLESVGNRTLTVIQKHLESCSDCQKELKEAFEEYRALGFADVLNVFDIKLSEGIQTETDFLKSWHFQTCSNDETNESVWISLQNKLERKEVQEILRTLRSRQMRVISLTFNRAPDIIIRSDGELVSKSLKELRTLLGSSEFSLFMTDEYGERDKLMEELTSFWEGKHIPKK